MADNFDIKNFLFENKLGAYSKLKSEDLGDGLADAEAEKEMDFLAEDFKYFKDFAEFEKELFDKWPDAKDEKYKKEYEDGRILYSDGYVNWGVWDPNRPNTPSGKPPGAVNQNVGMTVRDLMYPNSDSKGTTMDENIEEAMNNPLLQQVEKAMSALEILHSNTSTNSEIPTVSKEGLLRAFDALSDMLEVIASNIEQDEDEYASDYSKRRAQELDEASDNPEGDKLVSRFLQGIAKKYDYSEKDAAYFVKERLKKLGY
jgi:hypothetical protein